MEYDPSDVEILSTPELIRKRPGMYLGGTDRVAAALLITCAVDVLSGLTVDHTGDRGRGPIYRYHAMLDVSMVGPRVTVSLDYTAKECPDFDARCQYLIENRDQLARFRYAIPQYEGHKGCAPFPIISALSTGTALVRSSGEVILADPDPVEVRIAPGPRDSKIAIGFEIRDIIDLSEMSEDFLAGFVHGYRYIPGLVVNSVTYRTS